MCTCGLSAFFLSVTYKKRPHTTGGVAATASLITWGMTATELRITGAVAAASSRTTVGVAAAAFGTTLELTDAPCHFTRLARRVGNPGSTAADPEVGEFPAISSTEVGVKACEDLSQEGTGETAGNSQQIL